MNKLCLSEEICLQGSAQKLSPIYLVVKFNFLFRNLACVTIFLDTRLFFDNYFTSPNLIGNLLNFEIYFTGTVEHIVFQYRPQSLKKKFGKSIQNRIWLCRSGKME